MKLARIVSGLLLIASCEHALAWGQNGHRIVGQIASVHLTKTTHKAIAPLLAGDSLAEVGTWADEMRSAPGNFWQKESSRWHYINVDDRAAFDPHQYHTPHSRDDVKDIYGAMLQCIAKLKAKQTSFEERQFYLRFLVHLVGDLHQPMHTGHAEDRGGNNIKLTFFGKPTNLHSLWDTELIESQNLSFSEFAAFIDTQDQQQLKRLLTSGPADWLTESMGLSETIYQNTGSELGYAYIYQNLPIAQQRLQYAGIRLAGLLNSIYDRRAKAGVTALAPIASPNQ
jgi:hypothetical protein